MLIEAQGSSGCFLACISDGIVHASGEAAPENNDKDKEQGRTNLIPPHALTAPPLKFSH